MRLSFLSTTVEKYFIKILVWEVCKPQSATLAGKHVALDCSHLKNAFNLEMKLEIESF